MKRRRNIFKLGLRGAICLLLLLWIFHSIFVQEGRSDWERQGYDWSELPRMEQWEIAWSEGPPALWQTMQSIDPPALVLSTLVMGAILLVGVARWRLALAVQDIRLSWGRACGISFIAHFFNSFLLGSTGGDLMKAYYAARETHHKKTEAVVAVFVDRVLGLWTMLFFALVMGLFNLRLLAGHDSLRVLMLAIAGMFVAGTAFLLLAFRGGLRGRWTGAREWLRRLPKGEWLERSLDSCRTYGADRSFFMRMVGVSLFLNAVCVMQYVVLASGLGIEVSFRVWLMIVPAIICISAIPITPSGLGVRENLYVVVLASAPFLVSDAASLALSLIAYAESLFWSLVGGVVYLLLKDREHLAEVTEPVPEEA